METYEISMKVKFLENKSENIYGMETYEISMKVKFLKNKNEISIYNM